MKWLVYGLGESGTAAAQALLARNENVTVADSSGSNSSREAAERLGVEARFGAGPEVLNEGFDRIVASPGIRPRDALLAAAEKNGPPILSEVALGLELLKDEAPGVRVAAITGTNGKTTVVDMLGRMLAASGVPQAVAGNSWLRRTARRIKLQVTNEPSRSAGAGSTAALGPDAAAGDRVPRSA